MPSRPPIIQRQDTRRDIYDGFRRLADAVTQTQQGFGAIVRGEIPDGSGSPLIDPGLWFYKPGIGAGQTAFGGKNSAGNLTLGSTASPTKGFIFLGSGAAFDETNARLGISTLTPQGKLEITDGNGTFRSLPTNIGSAVGFKNASGGGANYTDVNTYPPTDTTYIHAELASSTSASFVMMPIPTPPPTATVTLTVRTRFVGNADASVDLLQTIRLYTGASVLLFSSPNAVVMAHGTSGDTGWYDHTYVLSGADFATVPDWSSLILFIGRGGMQGTYASSLWAYSLFMISVSNAPDPVDQIRLSNSTGTVLHVNGYGDLGMGIGNTQPRGMIHVQARALNSFPLILQGAASQTADLTQWQNSGATVVARMSPVGLFVTTTFRMNTGENNGNWLRCATNATATWQLPGALTSVNDTNVTLTLGGSPTIALLNAASLTLGWTGTLSVARGGTGMGTEVRDTFVGYDDDAVLHEDDHVYYP